MTDRRSGNERRRTERFKLAVDIEWENHQGRFAGTLGDISERGCFVLASGDLADGERVFVYLPTSGGGKLKLAGEVSNHIFEIGFAATFIDMDEASLAGLRQFIEAVKKD